ncbi:MAG: pilus assembly protein, partial [Methylophilaceae bacterium]
VFLGKPKFEYVDSGYSAFATSQAGRARTVYVGANDGMLHAFDADTGAERWAYIPTAVIPNLYKLADKNYRNNHTNFVNAEITVADICVSACASAGVWKTILVSGLGQGGRGYFALDITNPLAPSFLWEISDKTESNLGYSYGKPVVTKRGDGTWVVLLTSGYNNVSPGDGKGYLYVLNASDGDKLAAIPTGAGGTLTPSGLAQVAAYADSPSINNQSRYVYGGDLSGKLWRFNIDANTSILFTDLGQPISVSPTLGKINGKRIIYIGTGKYLEKSDLLPANYTTQSLYAIKDDDVVSTLTLGATLVEQSLSGSGSTRTGSNLPVDFSTGNGWFIDLPLGERQNVKSFLVAGILYVPTLMPPTGTCDSNGRGYLNAFDYKTGGPVPTTSDGLGSANTVVSWATDSPIAGSTTLYGDGKVTFSTSLSNGGTGGEDFPAKYNTTGFSGKRAVWRELME